MGNFVFDLDGTLVDSALDLHACSNRFLKQIDLPPLGLETVTGFIGNGVGKLVERVLRESGVYQQGTELDASIGQYIEIYAAAPAKFCKAYPGVMTTLASLKADGHQLGICTNKTESLARLVVKAVGLDKYCTALIGGDTLPVRKPNPKPIFECARQLGDIGFIYVGDSETDAFAAEHGRIPFLLHTQGYRKRPAEHLYHSALFSNWHEFRSTVEGL
ncbi:MAG: phosphoglycolate phosphatase [Robiginitomaculum sp.]